jgi:hypothetical protein
LYYFGNKEGNVFHLRTDGGVNRSVFVAGSPNVVNCVTGYLTVFQLKKNVIISLIYDICFYSCVYNFEMYGLKWDLESELIVVLNFVSGY